LIHARDLAVIYWPSLHPTTRRSLLGVGAVAICDSVRTGEGVACGRRARNPQQAARSRDVRFTPHKAAQLNSRRKVREVPATDVPDSGFRRLHCDVIEIAQLRSRLCKARSASSGSASAPLLVPVALEPAPTGFYKADAMLHKGIHANSMRSMPWRLRCCCRSTIRTRIETLWHPGWSPYSCRWRPGLPPCSCRWHLHSARVSCDVDEKLKERGSCSS
jgi:hypothetical protein